VVKHRKDLLDPIAPDLSDEKLDVELYKANQIYEADPLRANISETLLAVIISEQGEEEKNRDEYQFSWCCVSGGRGWRGTKRRRA
jgi:hypothetical protein